MDNEDTAETGKLTDINDLPNEILEYIISLLLPYEDLERCMLVSKRWQWVVRNVIKHKKSEFYRAISNFKIQWENKEENSRTIITRRYSHSACSHENSMYVFGGCTCASTTFNDLWKLDLSTRSWHRLLTMGSYPCPKACASLVSYNNSLILFGGWSHPSPYPLHQTWRTFNELHVYDIALNRWSAVTSPTVTPPPMAGHAATVHGDNMVVFGGLLGHNGGSNDVWCLNLQTLTWVKKETSETKPHPRYGHSQIAIDENHLFILGGWGGPPNLMMNDVWMLNMEGRVWTWSFITVNNSQWAASHLWCHPACKVNDHVVVLSRNPESTPLPLAYSRWTSNSNIGGNPNRRLVVEEQRRGLSFRNSGEDRVGEGNGNRRIDRDVNVNGRRGILLPRGRGPERVPAIVIGAYYIHSMNILTKPINMRNRERQLDALRRMEEKLKNALRPTEKKQPTNLKPPKMAMFVLDISRILDEGGDVSWLPVKRVAYGSPDSTIFYSLVKGNSELIMFGGMKKDASSLANQSVPNSSDGADTVSNSLHFITAPIFTV